MIKKLPKEKKGKSSDMRKAVKDRVKEEMVKHPVKADKEPKIKSKTIRWAVSIGQEFGDGLLYTKLHSGTYCYNTSSCRWIWWNGFNWEEDTLGRALAAVEDLAARLIEEHDEISAEISWNLKKDDKNIVESLRALQAKTIRRIKKLRSKNGVNSCLFFAHNGSESLAVSGELFDLHPWLLPCANGVIDLRSGKFRDGRPDEYLFLSSPTDWKGLDEPCERWEAFLLEIQDGKKKMVDYIQRLLGYAITGLNIEHVFPVLYGPGGRNGKSKLVEALNFTLGAMAAAVPSELLLDQGRSRNSAGPSPDIMGFKGLRLAFAAETDEGQRFSASRVKWLTGGDQLVGRYPHDRLPVHFTPTHCLFLLTNRKPSAPGDDHAFWERMHLIPFRLSFVNREPVQEHERRADKYIGEKLKKEASGILSWLVRGCLAYQKEGLNPPLDIIEATAEYRRNEDLLADWLEDYCNVGPDEKGQASTLYDHFARWFKQNVSRKKEFTQRRFGTLLGRRFEKIKTGGSNTYIGINLNPLALSLESEED